MNNNNSKKRILSASMASWINILLTVVIQILLVPIYLKFWGIEIYGLWLLFMGIWAILIIPYTSYIIFIGFEIIKISNNKKEVNKIMSSITIFALIISVIQLLVSFLFKEFANQNIINISTEHINLLGQLLVIYSLSWLFTQSIHTVLEKWLIPYGFNPYFAWFRTIRIFITNFVAVIVIFLGFDILSTVIAMVFSDLIIHFISFLILRKTFEKLELCWSQDYSIILGLIYLKKSLWLMLKYLLDSIRNIGIRVLLSRDLSTSKIALFSTHRTPSNVFVQAINSLTYSMQPELMLSIRDREDTKIYFYNTFLWLILSILILPIIYIIQALMPAIFEIWTMGKLTFDPIIFSIFLIIAIIYTVYSPFEAIMKGNNLGEKLSLVSIISSLTLIVFIYLSIKEYEILGASISLLISEIVVLILNSYFAINWLRDNKFNTTYIAFILIMINLLINSIILFYISKNGFNLLFCLSGIFISITISIGIWYTYTPEVRKKILKFIKVK